MSDFTCARHTAEVYVRGGVTYVGELTPLTQVVWNRIRDDISTANVYLPPTECCELLSEVRSGYHELHLFRDGEPVWEGPITRVEYERDEVRIYAEDMMWVPKRTVLQTGYSHAYPNIGYAIDRIDWLLKQQCYNLNGDPWRMLPHLHCLTALGTGPKTSRAVAAYEMYVWQDFDKFAEDHGLDYVVVNRDVYYWDHGLNWLQLPEISEEFLSDSPRVVEYGNDLYTRAFVSNARGYAGIAVQPSPWPETYGYVDLLITNLDDSGDLTEKLSEAQDEVTKAQDVLENAQEEHADAVEAERTIGLNAEYLRALADMWRALADQQEAKSKNVQWLAGEWQRWADALQSAASDSPNSNKALNDAMKSTQKQAETAARDAEEKKEKSERQQEVADTSNYLAQITGDPARIAFALQQAANVPQFAAEAETARVAAVNAQAAADAARAAAAATNDPGLQAQADTVQTEANRQAQIQRDEKLLAINFDELAKSHEKDARDMESELARAAATTQSWMANIAEAEQELDWAINGRHGVPGKEDKDGVADVMQEIAEATKVWADTAARNLIGHAPAPLGIVVPANTTLLPGSGWKIQDLVPGAQFHMTVERLCRSMTSQLMINEVRVEESAPDGEKVQLTADTVGVAEIGQPIP